MAESNIDRVERRIDELGAKSTQILTFLSFAIIAAVTLSGSITNGDRKMALSSALNWWLWAIYPVMLGIVPVKEFRPASIRWYEFVRWSKFALLWIAAILILIGLVRFIHGL